MPKARSLTRSAGAGPAVPAVARAPRLLNALAVSREAMPLAGLVKALQLPKSTVHGLCVALVDAGLLAQLDNGAFQLGTRVMDLAHAHMARTDVATEFQAIVRASAPMPEESLVLSVLDGADIVYVARRNGSRPFGFNFRIGMRLPAHRAASGKAMLAALPAGRVIELALARSSYTLTPRSVTRIKPLLEQLAQVRQLGYAVDDEETRQGMVCIGAPVFGPMSSDAVAAVALSCTKSTLKVARKGEAVRTVKYLAATISQRMGSKRALK